ncbi:CHAT domain-containing protein [Portibacter lacus]|uniref:CHAT domain-containing protein n=1 Tax=Portibacter lacus TaxID=1099794 RepID=A0AA37SLD1_9BACT|nr:CHAT domain-containing protein [Portibacter lacus]GLR16127.1 hypothetical protein GCM10007940_07420 [Portibacter lacus]
MRIVIIFLLTCHFLIGQSGLDLEKAQDLYDQGKKFYYDAEYREAAIAFDSCLAIRSAQLDSPHNLIFKVKYRIANNYMKLRNYEQSEDYLSSTLEDGKALFGPESDEVSRVLGDFGVLYSRKRQFSKSILWNQKSIDLKKKLYGSLSKEVAYTRMNNSNNYYGQGNYVKCINELKEILKIYDKELDPDDQNYNRVYLTLSQAYRKKGDLDNALVFAEKAVEIKLKNYEADHPSLRKYYDNLAKVQASLNQLEQSKSNFKKAEKVYEGYGSKEDLGSHLNDAARVYVQSGEFRTAQEMFEQAAELFKGNVRKQAIARSNIAICKYYSGAPDEGIEILESALRDDPDLENFLRLCEWKIEVNDMDGARLAYQEATAISVNGDDLSKVKLLVLSSKLDKSISVDRAWASINEAIEVLTKMRRKYLGSESKNYLNERLEGIFDYAVELSVDKYRLKPTEEQLADVYKTIEMAKSASFWDNLSEENAAYLGKVPADLIEEIEILKRGGEEMMLALEERMTALEMEYPLYYKRKYTLEVPELSFIKTQIDEDMCVIDYYVLEDSVYAVVLTSEGTDFISQSNTGELTFDLEWEYLKDKSISRVSIVPHRFIHFISFEEIINQETQDYFLYDFAFSYQVNIEALIKSRDLTTKLNYLGIAPTWTTTSDSKDFAFRNDLVPLPGASVEIDKAASYFKSTVLKGEDAKEEAFYLKAPDFNFIHFATHAKIDPTNELNSYLYFNSQEEGEDGILHTDEIMNTDLRADLVLLSACETGGGGLKSGEGVMSLSRAFQYAGAKSVLMSLWRANDHSAQPIILNFIKNYKNGMPKDVALQKSKIKYIEKADPLMRDEIYWAGFMINGDVSPIHTATPWGRSFLFIGLGICLLILLLKFA